MNTYKELEKTIKLCDNLIEKHLAFEGVHHITQLKNSKIKGVIFGKDRLKKAIKDQNPKKIFKSLAIINNCLGA